MDLEFHYYITHLIAARAGFSIEQVKTIAYSSQYTDDNTFIFKINEGEPEEYCNYLSQTMDILKPQMDLFRIYPLFHFIPGDPLSPTAKRKDGKLHMLNTTPNSLNANMIFDGAIRTNNLYRIGIACHSFADTFAHQNFVGYYDEINAFAGLLETAIPNIGHACALHQPDWPGLVWEDSRLYDEISQIDNKKRFLEASKIIFEKLRRIIAPEIDMDSLKEETDLILKDLEWAIGMFDSNNENRSMRIERYVELSRKEEYGSVSIEEYNPEKWLDEAVNEEVIGLRDRINGRHHFLSIFPDRYTWKDRKAYKDADWYKFQEAIKQHQNSAWNILEKSTFSSMNLSKL